MQDPQEIVNHLLPTDALSILKTLAANDKELAARIAEVTADHLSEVDPDEIATDLYDQLDALKVKEVWDRVGQTRHGYVEPDEAVSQMIKEMLKPFLEELDRYQQVGMNTEANRMCMGLLLGLYRFEHESSSEFKNWATDAPIAFAEEIVDAWKAGSLGRADTAALKAFIKDKLGGWGVRQL